MPNHCWNTLKIIGPAEDIAAFAQHQLRFSHFFPIPPLAVDSHIWCAEHWGTKWEHWEYEVAHQDDYVIEMQFTTAWSPPLRFLEYLIQQHTRCWYKLTWSTEASEAGLWVAHNDPHNGITVTETHWCEPEPYPAVDGTFYVPPVSTDELAMMGRGGATADDVFRAIIEHKDDDEFS